MNKFPSVTLFVKTANGAGAKPADQRDPRRLGRALGKGKPDVVAIQEATVAWGKGGRVADDLLETLRKNGMPRYRSFFVPTVGTRHHPCPPTVPGTADKPGKWFNDAFRECTRAEQGGGLLVRSDWALVHLFTGKPSPGLEPACLQISAPTLFLGDRVSEPRCLIIARLRQRGSTRELIAANVHLTKLRADKDKVSGAAVRLGQIKVVIRALESLRKYAPHVPIVLLGDFNARRRAREVAALRKGGFELVTKGCKDATHLTERAVIDHVFVRPPEGQRVREESSRTVLGLEKASDHRPVEATFKII